MHRLDDSHLMTGHVTSSEIQDCINIIPALFWRIEVTNNRIEYLNSHKLPGLGDDSNLLLQNMNFSRDVILDDDYPHFTEFISSVKDRKAALTIIRIKRNDSTVNWLKLVGSPDPYRSNYYLGYILEITSAVDIIRHIDGGGPGITAKIQIFENPVVICDFSRRKVRSANWAACSFFGYNSNEFEELFIKDIFSGEYERQKQAIFEDLIFHERWNGEMQIRTKDGQEYLCDATLRPMVFEGENLLWISIYNISKTDSEPSTLNPFLAMDKSYLAKSSESADAMKNIAEEGDLKKILSMLIEYQPFDGLTESVLYSDIHRKDDIVQVYGCGTLFEKLKFGEIFPFEGTIAENILKFNLQHIIVEDTMKSIKPIDWALFIPQGVRSYYAHPFYDEKELRTVLIFCSGKPGVFTAENVTAYRDLFPFFLKGLESCKKHGIASK